MDATVTADRPPFPSFSFTALLNDENDDAPEQAAGDAAAQAEIWSSEMPIKFTDALPHTPIKEEDALFLPDDLAEQIAGLNIETDESDRTLLLLTPPTYKHVFSRKWVAKKYLASIVERPQRLNACAIGIGSAMALAGENAYVLDNSTATRKLTDAPHVAKVHGADWPDRLRLLCEASAEKLRQNEIEVPSDWNSGDIYLSDGTMTALEGVVGALETAVDRVFDANPKTPKRSFVSIRPPGHHSHPCTPSGFCLINNVHVAIQYAAAKHGLTHAVILDFDLHHGDGSQDICWKLSGLEEQEAGFYKDNETANHSSCKIGYFSLHDVNSFPTEVGYATAEHIKNASTCVMAHDLCIWNIHLEPYSTSQEFDELYRTRYSEIFTRAAKFLSADKDVVAGVFLSAGFDASEYEDKGMQRHGVHVPTSFYSTFTRDAVALADKFAGGRVISVLEGGYSDAALCSGVMAHLLGLQGLDWKDEYASATTVKQLEKGCKSRWSPPKAPTPNWIVRGIRTGRAMVPADAIASSSSSAESTPLKVASTPSGRVLRDRRGTPLYSESNRMVPNDVSPSVSRKVQDPLAKHKLVQIDGS